MHLAYIASVFLSLFAGISTDIRLMAMSRAASFALLVYSLPFIFAIFVHYCCIFIWQIKYVLFCSRLRLQRSTHQGLLSLPSCRCWLLRSNLRKWVAEVRARSSRPPPATLLPRDFETEMSTVQQ